MARTVLLSWRMLDRIAEQLEKYMDLVSTRQKLVAANIANVDTPGYRTKDIAFQMEFQTLALGEKPRVVEVPDLKVKNDGNDVNLDREARLLSENNLRFTFAESLLKDDIKGIRSAIQEGK
jgi:flagellar basal-body rod protein FlgB